MLSIILHDTISYDTILYQMLQFDIIWSYYIVSWYYTVLYFIIISYMKWHNIIVDAVLYCMVVFWLILYHTIHNDINKKVWLSYNCV